MDIKSVIIKELLETSSSSDEDEELILSLVYRNHMPRVKGFIINVVHIYSDADFKKNFRISRESAAHLIERYSESFQKRCYQGGRLQTSVETQILLFLWFSGNKTTIREVANLFDLSVSNVHGCFNNVLNFLVNKVAPEVIKFPSSDEEKQKVADEFKMISGIPNILGCIDGSYINARTPKHKIRSTYANRHDGVSITLQGVCDSKLRFLDVFTGVPSKIHDSRVLKLSFIGNQLQSLCSSKYYLLGDAAYPLREYLLTPYRDYGNLNDSEKSFNVHFSRARVKIENAFCLLKNRFRQLMRLDFHSVEPMAKFVIACCVLHNICIDRNETLSDEISNTEPNTNNDMPLVGDTKDMLLTQLGKIKRNEVMNFLSK